MLFLQPIPITAVASDHAIIVGTPRSRYASCRPYSDVADFRAIPSVHVSGGIAVLQAWDLYCGRPNLLQNVDNRNIQNKMKKNLKRTEGREKHFFSSLPSSHTHPPPPKKKKN